MIYIVLPRHASFSKTLEGWEKRAVFSSTSRKNPPEVWIPKWCKIFSPCFTERLWFRYLYPEVCFYGEEIPWWWPISICSWWKNRFFFEGKSENTKACLNPEILVFHCGNQTSNVKEILSSIYLDDEWSFINSEKEWAHRSQPPKSWTVRLLTSFWRVNKFPAILHPINKERRNIGGIVWFS